MEYIYAALLLHKAGKEINEENIKKVLESAGIAVDEARVKSLCAALDGVNIDEVIKKASSISIAQTPQGAQTAATAPQQGEKQEKKKEEKKEEKKVSEEEAAAGLGALFG